MIEERREGGKDGKRKREKLKEISQLTLFRSKHCFPNPPASAVSLYLSISSSLQKAKEKTLAAKLP